MKGKAGDMATMTTTKATAEARALTLTADQVLRLVLDAFPKDAVVDLSVIGAEDKLTADTPMVRLTWRTEQTDAATNREFRPGDDPETVPMTER